MDSVGSSEYQECCNKVMALAKTLVEESLVLLKNDNLKFLILIKLLF